ncbi:hypothetical protein BGZ72_002038 [Mortierella alpina]|nr:hypothetical protein BGZ72_002038 [Mortierella alpina]
MKAMVRLHLHSVLLAALAVTQVAIPFVAGAPAASYDLQSGKYKIRYDDDSGLTVVTENGSQKLRPSTDLGDTWEVTRTVSGAYTFRSLKVSSKAYICFPPSPSALDVVGICSDPDSGAKITLEFIPGGTFKYRLVADKTDLSVQIDEKNMVVLRQIPQDQSDSDEWLFIEEY